MNPKVIRVYADGRIKEVDFADFKGGNREVMHDPEFGTMDVHCKSCGHKTGELPGERHFRTEFACNRNTEFRGEKGIAPEPKNYGVILLIEQKEHA